MAVIRHFPEPCTRCLQCWYQGQGKCSLCYNIESGSGNNRTACFKCHSGRNKCTCHGTNNGTITISGAAGGYGTYQYTINGGAVWQSWGTFTNLAPGSYDVRIRDAAHPGMR